MHICILTNRPLAETPSARVSVAALARAGNEITEVRVVSPSAPAPGRGILAVPSRVPSGRGKAGALLRRSQPERWRLRNLDRRVAAAAVATGADLFMPVPANLVGAAVVAAGASGGAVMRTPTQPDAGAVDLVHLAPCHPAMNRPPAGAGTFHTTDDDRAPDRPAEDRMAGRKVAMAYRKTDTNPGKYLEAALRRSGAEVRLETDTLDLDSVDDDTDFILLVEGPYPAIEVTGPTPDIPILFWAHHGEHHLNANLRLADRYRADAVLLAHSWHLSHWVPAPVHRFPFGLPTELLDPSTRLADRRYDVAMVGAKLWEGGPYTRRQQIVADLEASLPPERLGLAENVSAEEMARLYEQARIIVNEGGTRHYPITMRVFETVGAGAALVTDDVPGTDLIFRPGEHYAILADDIGTQVSTLLSDVEAIQRMADAALAHGLDHHTYDHRVDELFHIVATTTKRSIPPPPSRSDLATLIDRDVEVQRVAQVGAPDLADDLDSRQVFDAHALEPGRLAPAKMETVAVRGDDVSGLSGVLRSARRYLYFEGAARGLDEFLASEHPQAIVERSGALTRVDLVAESYRVLPHETVPGGEHADL